MFTISLYIASALSLAGILFQIFKLQKTGSAGLKLHTVKSNLAPAFFNTLFQTKLFKASRVRWCIHFLVFSGFIFLLFFHALDELVSNRIFSYYQPTVDPYQFLRNFAGFLVGTGCLGFLIKKFHIRKNNPRLKSGYNNLFSIFLTLLVILSGFMLETSKIISEPVFMEMVEDYAGIDEDSGLDELKIYWEKHYNVVFDQLSYTMENAVEEGEIINEDYCLDCHSKISSAFVSHLLSRSLKKSGSLLNQYRADRIFYHVHYLLCFLMLISLPFSRFFHILLIPFASMNQKADIEDHQKLKVEFNPVTLGACTDCRFCSDVCSVYPNYAVTNNIRVLPHHKIEAFKNIITGKHLHKDEMIRLKNANEACTQCNNCTDICPSNIDLQSLWVKLSDLLCKSASGKTDLPSDFQLTREHDISYSRTSFKNCAQCTICTNVCPVVLYSSKDENDMTPQQVMNLLRLGRKQMAAATLMVNNCLTCYSCQENCPSEIRVTDIITELREASAKAGQS